MYDGWKIIIGLIILVGFFTAPFWYDIASGKALEKPNPVLPINEKECVNSTNFMIRDHMKLLDTWRNDVVREGKNVYVSNTNKVFNMSLEKTCLNCHSNTSQFCDRCHNYIGESPYCWDCHIESRNQENKNE